MVVGLPWTSSALSSKLEAASAGWNAIPSLSATSSYVGRVSVVTIPISVVESGDASVTSRVIIAFEASPTSLTPGASDQAIYITSGLVVSNGSYTTMLDSSFGAPTSVSPASQSSFLAGTMWAPALHYDVTSRTLYLYYSVEATTDANGGGVLNVVSSTDFGASWSSPVAVVGVEGYIESGAVVSLAATRTSLNPSWAFTVVATPDSALSQTAAQVFVVRCVAKQSGLQYDISAKLSALSSVTTTGGTLVQTSATEFAVVVAESQNESSLVAAFTSNGDSLMDGWSSNGTPLIGAPAASVVAPLTFSWSSGYVNATTPTSSSSSSYDVVTTSRSGATLSFTTLSGTWLDVFSATTFGGTSSTDGFPAQLPAGCNTSNPVAAAPLPVNLSSTLLRPLVVVLRDPTTNTLFVGVATIAIGSSGTASSSAPSSSGTAIAITFSIVGIVLVALGVVYGVGRIRAQKASSEGTYLMPDGEEDTV